MLVHLHLPDPVSVVAACAQCDSPAPFAVVPFRHRWYVGQVCLRCRHVLWNFGVYDTPDAAQHALVSFVRSRLDHL